MADGQEQPAERLDPAAGADEAAAGATVPADASAAATEPEAQQELDLAAMTKAS